MGNTSSDYCYGKMPSLGKKQEYSSLHDFPSLALNVEGVGMHVCICIYTCICGYNMFVYIYISLSSVRIYSILITLMNDD